MESRNSSHLVDRDVEVLKERASGSCQTPGLEGVTALIADRTGVEGIRRSTPMLPKSKGMWKRVASRKGSTVLSIGLEEEGRADDQRHACTDRWDKYLYAEHLPIPEQRLDAHYVPEQTVLSHRAAILTLRYGVFSRISVGANWRHRCSTLLVGENLSPPFRPARCWHLMR